MKKIFAVSFLSLVAVTGGARAEVEQYNLNLATVEYVQDVENRLDDYVLSADVVRSTGQALNGIDRSEHVETYPDNFVPTIARVDAAIEEAVDNNKTKIYNINNMAEYENASQEVLEEVATGADVTKLLTMGMNAAIVGDTEGSMYVFEADNSRVPGLETTVKKSLVGAINSVYEEVQEKVNVEQGETNKNAIMITDSTGNVIPALVGDCANTTNKCALVTGVDANGNLALQWEVIARNVVQPTAEE